MKLLIDQGFFTKLDEEVLHRGSLLSCLQLHQLNHYAPLVVERYKLERFTDNKFWIGRAEWQLMIEEALQNSMTSGREVKLQTLLTSAFTFYATWRPGSMGWSFEEYRKRELVSNP
jgi:hypothetical protein